MGTLSSAIKLSLGFGALVPSREVVVKDDPHGFEEIRSTLLSRHLDSVASMSRVIFWRFSPAFPNQEGCLP